MCSWWASRLGIWLQLMPRIGEVQYTVLTLGMYRKLLGDVLCPWCNRSCMILNLILVVASLIFNSSERVQVKQRCLWACHNLWGPNCCVQDSTKVKHKPGCNKGRKLSLCSNKLYLRTDLEQIEIWRHLNTGIIRSGAKELAWKTIMIPIEIPKGG